MAKRKLQYWFFDGICILTVFIWAAAGFKNNHPLFQHVGVDNAIFLSIGKGITQGIIPYVELNENKGPLFFLLMALPQLLVDGSTGVYLLEVLIMLGNSCMIILCTRLMMREKYQTICAAIPLMLYIYSACVSENFCEEYNLFFMLLCITVLIHAYTGKNKKTTLGSFWLGVSFSAVALIKISDLPGVCLAVLFYFLLLKVREKKIRTDLIRFFIGIAVIAIPVFSYLWSVDATEMMFSSYILDNFVHVSANEGNGFLQERLPLLRGEYGFRSIVPVAAMMIAVCFRMTIMKSRRLWSIEEKWLAFFGIGLAIMNFGVAYIASSGFWQHLLMGVATLCLAVMIFCGSVATLNWKGLVAIKYVSAALTLLICFFSATDSISQLMPDAVAEDRKRQAETIAFQQEFLPELQECESVCTLGVGIMPDWYWINGLQPAFRYYNIHGFIIYNVGKNVAEEFEMFLAENGCEYLVTDRPIELFRGQLTDGTIDYINENYELILEGSQNRLLFKMI